MSTSFVSTKNLFCTWLALMVLLVLTWGLAELNLGAANTAVALGIAGAKVLLVAVFFMQLRYSSRLTWIFAGAGLVWLSIMIVLTLSDYLTRQRIDGSSQIDTHFMIQSSTQKLK